MIGGVWVCGCLGCLILVFSIGLLLVGGTLVNSVDIAILFIFARLYDKLAGLVCCQFVIVLVVYGAFCVCYCCVWLRLTSIWGFAVDVLGGFGLLRGFGVPGLGSWSFLPLVSVYICGCGGLKFGALAWLGVTVG